jgi:predicted nucleic acid-binding protein
MNERIVLDTSAFINALRGGEGASRAILRLCLQGRCQPLMGDKLFNEFEDVLRRGEVFQNCALGAEEREELFDAFLSMCDWVSIFYIWRPNLPDEGDNQLIELAVAGMATTLITQNVRDLRGGELRFPQLAIEPPAEFMNRWRKNYGHDDHPTA